MLKIIRDINSSIGVKLPRIQAEEARLRLIKAGILLKTKKIIKNRDFVYLPISDSASIVDILEDLEYQLEYQFFPDELLKPSIIDS